jgi:hypothetical protein
MIYLENEKKIYLAMLSEQCERYTDMIRYLEELITIKKEELNFDERNLLSIAYKNYISEIRNAIRVIMAYENKESTRGDSPYLPFIIEYKDKIRQELEKECLNICFKIEKLIMPKLTSKETKVFFGKMKGDYYRYIAENTEGDVKKKYSDLALNTYNETVAEANNLNYKNSEKLGLLLNLSVFYYEVASNPKEAYSLANETLKKAKEALKGIDEDNEEYKDSLSIVNLLHDNIEMWEMETQDLD